LLWTRLTSWCPASVRADRKRAFARLGIPFLNALFTLVLRAPDLH
jgi:hypothetical protein